MTASGTGLAQGVRPGVANAWRSVTTRPRATAAPACGREPKRSAMGMGPRLMTARSPGPSDAPVRKEIFREQAAVLSIQTVKWSQKPPGATLCGFDSYPRHQFVEIKPAAWVTTLILTRLQPDSHRDSHTKGWWRCTVSNLDWRPSC